MKLEYFRKEAIVLVKNFGVHNAGKILMGVGTGALSYVGLSHIIPSWKSQTVFDEKYKKVCTIVGLAAVTSGTLMEDLSLNRTCLMADIGVLSPEYLATIDLVPKG